VEPISLMLIALTGVMVTAVIAFWEQILSFVRSTVLPWVERSFPELRESVATAFAKLDGSVVTVRRAIISAWRSLKPHFISLMATFEETSDRVWVRRLVGYVRREIQGTPETVKKYEVEEEILWHDLPEDVREQILRTGRAGKADVLQERDREVTRAEMEMTT